MKILWVCNLALPEIAKCEGLQQSVAGGWLVGLLESIRYKDNIEVSIMFPNMEEKSIDRKLNKVHYISFRKRKTDPSVYDDLVETQAMNLIESIDPDLIHIFGTEFSHTLAVINASENLDVLDKVVISIQGLTSVYAKHYYAYLPYDVIKRYTIRDFVKRDNLVKQKFKFEKRGKNEIECIKRVRNVIGRTDWDKACVLQINPNINYFFCNETLRNVFYKYKWNYQECDKCSIFLSQGSYPIKGLHLMLEALPIILNKFPKAKVYVTGLSPQAISFKHRTAYDRHINNLIEKYKLTDKIIFLGFLSEKDMCKQYLKSNVFVSASSIENSPNSVGEAMILGMPVVASDVGGIKNMLEHKVEGFIYQADATYMLAYYIMEIFSDVNHSIEMGENARSHALKTHDKIVNSIKLVEIYEQIFNQQRKHESNE